jgi:peroxiredoxin
MRKYVFLILLFPQLTLAITGLKVGDKAPDLTFKDSMGKDYNFQKEIKKTIVVFYRGSWCPYCIRQLKSIESEVMPKINKNTQLVAISVDKKQLAKKLKNKNSFSFRVISDSKAKSLKAFNLTNKVDDNLVQKYKSAYSIDLESDSGETHHIIAHPAVFVIKNGSIVYSDVHIDYKTRTKNAEILKAIK